MGSSQYIYHPDNIGYPYVTQHKIHPIGAPLPVTIYHVRVYSSTGYTVLYVTYVRHIVYAVVHG